MLGASRQTSACCAGNSIAALTGANLKRASSIPGRMASSIQGHDNSKSLGHLSGGIGSFWRLRW